MVLFPLWEILMNQLTIDLIKSINSSVKDAVITSPKKVNTIPTGSLLIDAALTAGGFPFGHISEIYGSESGGKTTICLTVCGIAQKLGMTPVYIDTEYSYSTEYASKIGIDKENIIIIQPEYAEKAYTCIEAAIIGGAKLIILDSLGSMIPQRETQEESDIEDNQIGLMARINSKGIRRIVPMLKQHDVALIMVNQMRSKIGTMPGASTEDTPGGKALKHAYAIRLKLTRTGKDSDDEPNFITTKFSVQKNKIGPPYLDGETRILFGKGIDLLSEVVKLGIEQKVIKKSGAWYNVGDSKIQGTDAVCEYLKNHKDIYDTIIDGIGFVCNKEFYKTLL